MKKSYLLLRISFKDDVEDHRFVCGYRWNTPRF